MHTSLRSILFAGLLVAVLVARPSMAEDEDVPDIPAEATDSEVVSEAEQGSASSESEEEDLDAKYRPDPKDCARWKEEFDDLTIQHDHDHHPEHKSHVNHEEFLRTQQEHLSGLISEGIKHCQELQDEGKECPETFHARMNHFRQEMEIMTKALQDLQVNKTAAHTQLQATKERMVQLQDMLEQCKPRKKVSAKPKSDKPKVDALGVPLLENENKEDHDADSDVEQEENQEEEKPPAFHLDYMQHLHHHYAQKDKKKAESENVHDEL